MAKMALILVDRHPTEQDLRLSRILDFFGVPWKAVDVAGPSVLKEGPEQVVFGAAQMFATVMNDVPSRDAFITQVSACYVYPTDDRETSERALQTLYGDGDVSLQDAATGESRLRVSRDLPDLTGAMTGVEVSLRLRREDAILAGHMLCGHSEVKAIVSVGDAPVFVRFEASGLPVYLCASSYMVDIEQGVGPGFYDIKDHFCSAVPLVMFVRCILKEVTWQAQEHAACLIIDDPLLRQRYGFCDFEKLRDLMLQYEFTTNIGFIPWNWRRTSPTDSEFFRRESGRYSVSVHGCDHIGAEFAATSSEILDNKAKLAQSRMQNHESRTGIHHDPVMIFPQGVFSSVCPAVLKCNGFLAAVNTETVPVDSLRAQTKLRDLWDVAIMAYGSFPIFTRRYAFHGLENFAFDLLLGKPCLIVSHHDFFKDDSESLIDLLGNLRSLNCSLHWRSLGDVIRRACRRVYGTATDEVEMYGNDLLISNRSEHSTEVKVRKREDHPELITEILCDAEPVAWKIDNGYVIFAEKISPRHERRFQLVYQQKGGSAKVNRPLRFELSVAARRMLSEFRDNYLSQSSFLSASAASLRNLLARAN